MSAVSGLPDRRQQQITIEIHDRRGTPRRRASRITVDIPVTFQFKDRNFKAICKDIGLGGIRIHSEKLAPVGTKLGVQVSINRNFSFTGLTGLLTHSEEMFKG